MNRREYLMTCLAEECAEVAQRVSKALRFSDEEVQPGQGQTNAERICDELGDLISVALILRMEGLLPSFMPDDQAIEDKLAKIERFMKLSRMVGTLQDDPTPRGSHA